MDCGKADAETSVGGDTKTRQEDCLEMCQKEYKKRMCKGARDLCASSFLVPVTDTACQAGRLAVIRNMGVALKLIFSSSDHTRFQIFSSAAACM